MKTSVIANIFFLLLVFPFVIFLIAQLRFYTPIRLRIKYPKWDKFLCKVGSHRCISICGRGCCWECVRCKAEKEGKLTEHYEGAKKELSKYD